jgi:hypothetical protein
MGKRHSGKGHARAVNIGEHRRLVFGVAGRVADFELKPLPFEFLAMAEGAVHLEGPGARTTLDDKMFTTVGNTTLTAGAKPLLLGPL